MTKEEFAEICLEYVRAEKEKFAALDAAEKAQEKFQLALNRLSAAIIENPEFALEAQ